MTILPTKPSPRFLLVYLNTRGQRWYFVASGTDARMPGRLLIKETTMERSKAKVFDTAPEATAMLRATVASPEWAIEAA